MMQMKKLKNSDDAVVGIVVAILLIGLVVGVISTIQTVYVPKIMEEKEAAHMEEVLNQFSKLKTTIDGQSANKQEDVPMATSITLGSKELPFLMSVRAFGSLEILTNECTVTITKNATSSFPYSLGTIRYSSVNAYFPNQDYIYEAGAMILSQYQGNAISVIPRFSVTKEQNVTISFTLVNISAIGKKRMISGYGTYPIQTEYLEPDNPPFEPFEIKNISTITINTNYQNAWSRFINSTLINSGLNYYGYGTNFWINVSDGNVVIEFVTDSITVNLHLEVIEIGAQIAPGWIENIK